MNTFFYYFGAKHKIAHLYGRPQHNIVVEPFAGSAGYSVQQNSQKTILVEKNPTVAGVWQFLITATRDDIMDIPVVDDVTDIPSSFPQAVRDFVGFTFIKGGAEPRNRRSKSLQSMFENQEDNWHRKSWGAIKRNNVANNVMKIKNWEIIQGDFSDAPDIEAHWHVDPPYQILGKGYKCKFNEYARLAEFCMSRKGLVDACESRGADWLPFVGLRDAKNQNSNKYTEVICRIRDGVVCNGDFQMDNQMAFEFS